MVPLESYHPDYRLLPAILDRKAREDPDGIYACVPVSEDLTDGFRDFTYRDLLQAVDALTYWFESTLGYSSTFETLSYIGVSDLRYVIFFQACIKSGYKSLFLSPRNTALTNATLLQKTDCRYFFFSKEYEDLADKLSSLVKKQNFETYYLDKIEVWITRYTKAKPFLKLHDDARFDPIVVFHSSGSTGPPKTIIQNHQFFINGHRFPPLPTEKRGNFYDLYKFEEKSFILASFPFYHLAGFTFICLIPLFYESCAIACGMTNRPATPGTILQVRKIRLLNTPPSIIEGILRIRGSEAHLKQLETIIYAGGPLAKWAGDLLSQHTNCVTNYGSTESGPVALLLPDRSNWQWMDFHPAIDLKWENIYDNAHELVFERNDEADRFRPIGATILRSQSAFRSKDLFIPHPTQPGLWQFFGRNDDIIVLSSGLKYKPIPSEAMINAHPDISGTIITGTGLLRPIAIIERKYHSSSGTDSEFLNVIWPVIKKANQQTQRHGRVKKNHIILVEPSTLLRTPKGSISRQSTVLLMQIRIENCLNCVSSSSTSIQLNGTINSEHEMLDLVRHCFLQVSELEMVEDSADFVLLGLDSIDAYEIVAALRSSLVGSLPQYRVDSIIQSELVYRFSTISKLATALYEQLYLHKKEASEENEVIRTLLRQYSIHEFCPIVCPSSRPQESLIAISGTTGSLGSSLLKNLVQDSRWNKIICLNRSPDAAQRTRHLLRSFSDDHWSRVEFIQTRQNTDRLGLSDADIGQLRQCQSIVHCAWHVNFLHNLESFEMQLKNLKSLVESSLFEGSSTRLFFASSVSAIPRSAYNKVEERTYEDFDNIAATGYGQSKQVAESMLAEASKRCKIPITILRIGQIAGYDPDHAQTSPRAVDDLPIWNPVEWFPSVIRTSQTLRAIPDEFARIDWIPINILSQAIAEIISHDNSAQGFKVYNLVNPQTSPWSTIIEPLRECMSDPLDVIPLAEWIEVLKIHGKKNEVDLVRLPALKLLSFVESRANTLAKESKYSTDKAMQASPTMFSMRPIMPEQAKFWIKQWNAGWN